MNDLVIRNGLIVDGTGRPGFGGDVAVNDGIITQAGGKAGTARREIDANGCIVTPGFLDIHTHYDGQIRWDPSVSTSSWNGVTTVVMGNCGVGFAPVRPSDREPIMGWMEVIEDIPVPSMREGLRWEWETFPEFLDALDRGSYAIDFGTQIPHGAVRGYVMGARGIENEVATGDELKAMSAIVREAMDAGALGFTGTRTINHHAPDGRNAPGYGLPVDEVITLACAAAEAGHGGVVGFNLDFENVDDEFAWLRRLHAASGLPVFFLLNQLFFALERFQPILDNLKRSQAGGERIVGQHAGRAPSYLMGLMSSRNPFWERPSYEAISNLPLAERVARMRDPNFRATLLAEKPNYRYNQSKVVAESFHLMFRLGEPPDYEPPPEKSVAAMATATGRSPQEIVYDMMLERDGKELIFIPVANYLSGDASVVYDLFHHPNTLVGLGDGGAHVMRISDASIPTYMLAHWARDRRRGPKISLEEAVSKITASGAGFYGLDDRGVIAPGMKGDLNVIDFNRLQLRAPEIAFDQPAGRSRFIQHAEGYVATVVAGTPIVENDRSTGALPGRLVRSKAKARRPAPALR